MSDLNGNVLYTRSNSFGHYLFEGILAGGSYVFGAQAKGYTFSPRAVTVTEEITNLDLTPDP